MRFSYTNTYSAFCAIDKNIMDKLFTAEIYQKWEKLNQTRMQQGGKATRNELLNIVSEHILPSNELETYLYPKYGLNSDREVVDTISRTYNGIQLGYILVYMGFDEIKNLYGEILGIEPFYQCILIKIDNFLLLGKDNNTHTAFEQYSLYHANYANTKRLDKETNKPFYKDFHDSINALPAMHQEEMANIYIVPNINKKSPFVDHPNPDNLPYYNFYAVRYQTYNIIIDYKLEGYGLFEMISKDFSQPSLRWLNRA